MNKNYYFDNTKDYIDQTKDCDMSYVQNMFLNYLKPHSRILDIGFGSCRDMLFFKDKGFDVYGIDSNIKFCLYAQSLNLNNVYFMPVENIEFEKEFDAIWACASLLHVKEENLKEVFFKCYEALKENSYMYCSFKYGDFKGIKNERYFIYLTEKSLNEYIKYTKFKVEKVFITNDVRIDKNEKWLNVILRK